VKEMSFKSVVEGRGSDRWWERRWWLWWGDMRRMRWTRMTVKRMRLTEWRRELIQYYYIFVELAIHAFYDSNCMELELVPY